jgi:transcriptional repressor NrdR
MKCLFCDSDTSVIETRLADDGRKVVRRRKCDRNNHRFRTVESVGGVLLRKDGDKDGEYLEPFDRAKLTRGIVKALYKREEPKIASQKASEAAKAVEDKLLEKIEDQESIVVEPWEVGELVLDQLKRIDWLAWLRYLSVLLDEKKEVSPERRDEVQHQIDDLLDEILEIRK